MARRRAREEERQDVTVPKGGRQILHALAIPHEDQRYPTCGDWDDHGNIKVSALGNWRYEFLVALHEAVEYALCRARGISDAAVSGFDQDFEAKRPANSTAEPGDDRGAPYRREHKFATVVEQLVARELGVDWRLYSHAIIALDPPREPEVGTKEPEAGTLNEPDAPNGEQSLQPEGEQQPPAGENAAL